MTDDHAARELPGITVVIAPRGAGKSHLLWRSVIEARAREENAIWIDAGASHDAPALAPAELIVVDRVNPRDASHLALMQTVLTAFRGGSVCRVMIATRSAELLNHHLHPWLHDYTTVTAGGLALDPGRVAAMAERLGTSITEKQSALIADESDGWAWAASIGVAATRTRPRATDDDLRRSMRQRVRDAVAHQLTRQQRLVFTATTIIDHSTLSAAGVSDANTWLADAEADGWLTRDAADTPYRVPARARCAAAPTSFLAHLRRCACGLCARGSPRGATRRRSTSPSPRTTPTSSPMSRITSRGRVASPMSTGSPMR